MTRIATSPSAPNPMPPLIGNTKRIEQAFALLRERYAELGVDVEQALGRLVGIAVSLHCWQGDDVGGFEDTGAELGGGLTVTGSYPGKARTPDELRSDLDLALSLISGRHPLNRVAAWVIGARSLLKALRMVLLEPIAMLHEREAAGDFTARLAWLEEVKTLPFGAVWDYHCLRQDVSVGGVWLDAVRAYERDILARRQ